MIRYWNQLLYLLKIKERPAPPTVKGIIYTAMEIIYGEDRLPEFQSEIAQRRGLNALNKTIKEWSVLNAN